MPTAHADEQLYSYGCGEDQQQCEGYGGHAWAGHFVLANLVGMRVFEVSRGLTWGCSAVKTNGALILASDETSFQTRSLTELSRLRRYGALNVQAGTLFCDSAFQREVQTGTLSSASLDRYTCVALAGVATGETTPIPPLPHSRPRGPSSSNARQSYAVFVVLDASNAALHH